MDGKDHDRMLRVNNPDMPSKKSKTEKKHICHFRYIRVPFFGKIVSRKGV